MRKNESRLTTWVTGILIALLSYAGFYLGARHFYATNLRSGGLWLPRRVTSAGTAEGEAVSQMNQVFAPAIWMDEKVTGNQINFWVFNPAPSSRHVSFRRVP